MSTYYNYAERNAESYVNWGQIGKDVSKMLTDENDIREKKKKEIDDQSREFAKTLSEAPQGQYQDGNALINNFAADMQQTRLMDDRLLKSGQLKLKDYTLRRQNNLDGTTTLVDLQKVYQSTKKTMMDGITNGTLQALVGWNMQQMEAYQDFSNSKAVIDPATGIVNLGKTKLNDQGLRVLTNEVIPVNVMRNLMTTPIETFKVNETLDAVKKGLGSRIQTMQELASLTKTGSLTKLTGIGALEQFSGTEEGKKYQGVVDNWNSAIDDQMSSLLAANKYNLTSILTQNTGKYGSNSFTYDKKLAASDPTKILMIQNPSSSLPEMDPNAPHYKEQYEEAKGWMKDQLLSKIDLEVSKTITPQTQQLRPKDTSAEIKDKSIKDNSQNIGELMKDYLTGDQGTANLAGQALSKLTGIGLTREDDQRITSELGNISNTFDIKGQSYEKSLRALMPLLKDVEGVNTEEILKIALQNAPTTVSKVGTIKAEKEKIDKELEYINTVNDIAKTIPLPKEADRNKVLEAFNSSKLATQMGYSFDLSKFGFGGELIIYSGTGKDRTEVGRKPYGDKKGILAVIKEAGAATEYKIPRDLNNTGEPDSGGNGGNVR